VGGVWKGWGGGRACVGGRKELKVSGGRRWNRRGEEGGEGRVGGSGGGL